MVNLKDYAPFTGLLIFGNIENLILASQGAVAHVNPYILGGLSIIAVIAWLLLGTYGTYSIHAWSIWNVIKKQCFINKIVIFKRKL